MASFKGPMEFPSPITSSVTPCFISLIALPSASKETVAQESILTKPGLIARPLASNSFLPLFIFKSPIKAIVSLLMPISPLTGVLPVPSKMTAFLMITSYSSADEQD